MGGQELLCCCRGEEDNSAHLQGEREARVEESSCSMVKAAPLLRRSSLGHLTHSVTTGDQCKQKLAVLQLPSPAGNSVSWPAPSP